MIGNRAGRCYRSAERSRGITPGGCRMTNRESQTLHRPEANAPPPSGRRRQGVLLHTLLVLAPSALLLRAGYLLFAGMLASLAIAWVGMRLQGVSWRDMGLRRPPSVRTAVLTALSAALALVPATYGLRRLVTAATSREPNLEAFRALEGNVAALLLGLCVVWTFAAFGEELLFRGFLMNAFYRLTEGTPLGERPRWGAALVS